MTAISQALTSALLHFVWQGVAVAGLLWLALFILRKHSANSRYLASCLALAVLTLLPIVTAAVSYEAVQPLSLSVAPAASSFVAIAATAVARETSWLASAKQAEGWVLTVWSL